MKNYQRCSRSENSPAVKIMLEESSVWTSQTSLWNHSQSPECLLQPACSMPCSSTPFQRHTACVSPGTHFHSHTSWSMQFLTQQGRELGVGPSWPCSFVLFFVLHTKTGWYGRITHLCLELKRLGNKSHPENNRMRLRRIKRSENVSPKKKH